MGEIREEREGGSGSREDDDEVEDRELQTDPPMLAAWQPAPISHHRHRLPWRTKVVAGLCSCTSMVLLDYQASFHLVRCKKHTLKFELAQKNIYIAILRSRTMEVGEWSPSTFVHEAAADYIPAGI
jgi:hypothetical protein